MRVVCKDTIKCCFVRDRFRQNSLLKSKVTASCADCLCSAGETEKFGGENLRALTGRPVFYRFAIKKQLHRCNCLIAASVWPLACDTDRTQTCNLLIRRHNSAIFADLRRFLFCFIIIWFSDANIAILFRFIFVGFD